MTPAETTCGCNSPTPAITATRADGTTILLHPLLTREGEDPGAGGIICTKPTIAIEGKEFPYRTTLVGER